VAIKSPVDGSRLHIRGTIMSSHLRKRCAKRTLDELICESAPTNRKARTSYWRLITAIRASSQLLHPELYRGDALLTFHADVVRACGQMVRKRGFWKRRPETWIAPNGSLFVQFRSLVGHLFEEFPVPTFLVRAWCWKHKKPWEIALYLHLAAGRSVRQFEWPLPYPVQMTKREARWFMQAPHDCFSIGAWRWAQVRALGGDRRLADILMMATPLLIPTEHEEFWKSVICFLIANSPISTEEINEIVTFINQQRFQSAEKVWGRGAGPEPLQPEFSMKGRSLMSLRRHMMNWRTELLVKLPALTQSDPGWARSSIGAFRHSTGDTLWTIDELLSDRELRIEGGIMKHCVATYIQECAQRRTSIWSMKMQQGDRRKRTLTIEVLPNSKIVCQAKGKQNDLPDGQETEMLQLWAAQEGLTIRCL
jgi:hypothetical protein